MSLLEVLTFLAYLPSGAPLRALVPMIGTLLGAVIGGVSLTGSIVAFGKLQGFIPARPVSYPGQRSVAGLLLGGLVVIGILLALITNNVPLFLLFVAVALVTGVALVMPIGGADMPGVIGLAHTFTGIAVAAT